MRTSSRTTHLWTTPTPDTTITYAHNQPTNLGRFSHHPYPLAHTRCTAKNENGESKKIGRAKFRAVGDVKDAKLLKDAQILQARKSYLSRPPHPRASATLFSPTWDQACTTISTTGSLASTPTLTATHGQADSISRTPAFFLEPVALLRQADDEPSFPQLNMLLIVVYVRCAQRSLRSGLSMP